jgi:putative NADH-flavin reductase
MKIVVFGASGGTGRELIRQAVEGGHEVTAFARRTADSDSVFLGARVVQGDVTDPAAVTSALAAQAAALSALGAPTPFQPYPSFLEGLKNVLLGLERGGGRRLVYLSFVGVPESRDQFGVLGKYLIAPRVLTHATEGHRQNEEMIKSSSLDWTIVRAAKLTDGGRTSTYRVGEQLVPRGIVPSISRADVAHSMLAQLERPEYVRRCITVMQ